MRWRPLDFTTHRGVRAGDAVAHDHRDRQQSGDRSSQWYLSGGIFRNEIAFVQLVAATLPTSYWGVPAANQAAGDLHEFYASTNEPAIGSVQPARTRGRLVA